MYFFMRSFLSASVFSISQGKDLRITSRITCNTCRLMQKAGEALLMSVMNGELTSTRDSMNMRQAESLVQNSSVRLGSRISQTFLAIQVMSGYAMFAFASCYLKQAMSTI